MSSELDRVDLDPSPPRSRDVTHELRLTLTEAAHGVTRRVRIGTHRRCPRCDGAGAGGCELCGGRGTVPGVLSFDASVQPGVRDGHETRAKGFGHDLDGVRGDAILRIAVEPHPTLTREGDDLHTEILVPHALAQSGAKLEVEWLADAARVVLPAGTRDGDVIRVRGWGTVRHGAPYAPPPREQTAYRTASTERGDLLVRVLVERPLTRLDRALAWLAARLGLR